MQNEITSTTEMAETEWDGHSEPADVQTDMTATKKPEGGIEFYVQMRDYTKRDMEELIVEAAARVVVGNYGNNVIAKRVEERCIALVTEMADKHLAGIARDIIDQPILPKYPFMKADAAPMTMREFIGLTGRDYLEARVDRPALQERDREGNKRRHCRSQERHRCPAQGIPRSREGPLPGSPGEGIGMKSDRCAICGQELTWTHDHREDLHGVDDGPPLPKRKKPDPKPAEEVRRIRAAAWATRRQRYGERGHKGVYSR